MTTPSSISITISTYTHQQNPITTPTCKFLIKSPQPIKFYHLKCTKMSSFPQNCSNIKLCTFRNQGFLHGVRTSDLRRQKRVVLVKFNQFPNFNGGNDKRDDGTSARVLVNLALAVGLTYLTMTGQLGWVLDTIVSLWVTLSLSLSSLNLFQFAIFIARLHIYGLCIRVRIGIRGHKTARF